MVRGEEREGAVFSLVLQGEGQEGRAGEAARNIFKWYTLAGDAATKTQLTFIVIAIYGISLLILILTSCQLFLSLTQLHIGIKLWVFP